MKRSSELKSTFLINTLNPSSGRCSCHFKKLTIHHRAPDAFEYKTQNEKIRNWFTRGIIRAYEALSTPSRPLQIFASFNFTIQPNVMLSIHSTTEMYDLFCVTSSRAILYQSLVNSILTEFLRLLISAAFVLLYHDIHPVMLGHEKRRS